uniref:Uncharacterized protein n=1 Tax=Anguilla anguilla TaxID=7936 RepID=A0A0E9RC18_ANGAN
MSPSPPAAFKTDPSFHAFITASAVKKEGPTFAVF